MTNTTATPKVIFNPSEIMTRAHAIRKAYGRTLSSALRQAWQEAKRAAAHTIASYHAAVRNIHIKAKRAGHLTRHQYEAWLERNTGHTSCLQMTLEQLVRFAGVCATAPTPSPQPAVYASDEDALAVLG